MMTKEPFIPGELRPRIVPLLDSTPPLDPDCSPDELSQQALSVLGLSERAWEALHPEYSRRDLWACVFAHAPELTWNTLDQETVLLNTITSRYYTLNGCGTMIWGFFDGKKDLRMVLAAMLEEYAVDREQLERDLLAFAGQLIAEDLLRERV